MTLQAKTAVAISRGIWVAIVVLLTAPVWLFPASAQFNGILPGQSNLPQDDFTWTWGNQRAAGRGFADISVFGTEAGFSCDLKGKLRLGGRVSKMDIREIETKLRSESYFIRGASNAMNELDGQRELEWATLVCEKR